MIKLSFKQTGRIRDNFEILLRDLSIRSITAFLKMPKGMKKARVTRSKVDLNDIRVTIGRLNYKEREYIKMCREAKYRVRDCETIIRHFDKKGLRYL